MGFWQVFVIGYSIGINGLRIGLALDDEHRLFRVACASMVKHAGLHFVLFLGGWYN